ncbi:MAG: DHH family phosphoesterase [Eubacterium sp.]|jgi:c-di-AMP phosphodiesterase-like protein|nr:DHH family phosphoesterase [Eubacterium sp.]MCH4046879.1 DHH family phosphoesterase [Eubacterium sp.]MCH4079976.1 DHH family phosphoesterase [Eubacterium sp.]MCH4109982.1 DHH family phosphoesterase [Eubacterium sp.]MCI1307552.1 DHH family phosphoesterase [Eubacterium sp.]
MAELNYKEILTEKVPLPMCIVNKNGKIIDSNSYMDEVFVYDEIKDYDFFALTGIKMEELEASAESRVFKKIERNNKIFRLVTSRADSESDDKEEDETSGVIVVFFNDITAYEQLKQDYNNERICVARVNIDNYDEMKANTSPDMRMTISSEADKIIRKWAGKIGGSIVNMSRSEYIIYFEYRHVDEMVRNKFSILDEVRNIETQADFPMSLSIGVGIGGESITDTRDYADGALDLALGRGGDQAVVRRVNKIEYYGGKLQTVEKGNKGKSRVVAHALSRLIDQADRVMIMGHRNPDMDAFGAALGMFRVCMLNGKNSSIVIEEVNDSLQTIFKQAKEKGNYTFLTHDRAKELIDENTLLIVLDTHRPSFVECRDLLECTDRIVVIDHHRRAVDAIANPVLSYIESYASSTAELVTEILEYTGNKRDLDKLEAEALLAGMTVDTNRFAVKTGVRTFEAAAWLRRAGADTTEVKRLFQTDLDDFKTRSRGLSSAHIGEDGIATSICPGYNQEAQIINSQVADELLNVRGVKASFVAGRDETGQTVVSARSLGDINVQLIMEKLGGGGHLTTAGAQVEMSPEEVLTMVRNILDGDKDNEEKGR